MLQDKVVKGEPSVVGGEKENAAEVLVWVLRKVTSYGEEREPWPLRGVPRSACFSGLCDGLRLLLKTRDALMRDGWRDGGDGEMRIGPSYYGDGGIGVFDAHVRDGERVPMFSLYLTRCDGEDDGFVSLGLGLERYVVGGDVVSLSRRSGLPLASCAALLSAASDADALMLRDVWASVHRGVGPAPVLGGLMPWACCLDKVWPSSRALGEELLRERESADLSGMCHEMAGSVDVSRLGLSAVREDGGRHMLVRDVRGGYGMYVVRLKEGYVAS